MLDPARVTERESRGSLLLWIGTLTGPAAWSLQLVVSYNLEEFACAPGVREPGEIWGVGVESVMLVLHILLAAATFVAGLVAYHCWRQARGSEGVAGERAVWMGFAGIIVSALFLFMIVMGFAPQFFLEVCESAP